MTSLEQLQRRIADLELVAYRSAHDLKGPLITLVHFLKGLPASAKAGRWDDFDADIARMSRVLEQSQRMLDDLLQLARLDQPSATSGPLSIPELVLTAVRQSAAAVQSRGGASYSMGDNWPTILGDESQIVSVFQNLIENAAKFTPDANPDFEFDLGFRREDDRLIVMFRDFGVGIPAADWERVFEPFVRLAPQRPGTGLGLCIVKRIIERHGGRVWIEAPSDGPGTVICFTLPLTSP